MTQVMVNWDLLSLKLRDQHLLPLAMCKLYIVLHLCHIRTENFDEMNLDQTKAIIYIK